MAGLLLKRALTIVGTPTTTGEEDVAYSSWTAVASGGRSPYTFSIASGTLPTGVTLNASTGVVSGTPTLAGTYGPIVIRVTDSKSGEGRTASLEAFSIVVDGPPAATDVVISFGRLTLVGAGDALQSLDVEGGPYTSITLGTRTVGSNHFSGGASLVPTSVPSDDQYVWTGCTLTGPGGTSDTFSLTINTEAFTYSYASRAQLEAIVALGAATLSGKTAKGRSGTYTGNGTRLALTSLAPTSVFTIAAYTSRGVTFPGVDFTGSSKFTLDGLVLDRSWQSGDGTASGVIHLGNTSDITINDCEICSSRLVSIPTLQLNIECLSGTRVTTGTSNNLTITECYIHDCNFGLVTKGDTVTISDNLIEDCYINFCETTNPSNFTFTNNRACGIWANSSDTGSPHSSVLGFSAAQLGSNILIQGNFLLAGTNRFDQRGDKGGQGSGPKFNDTTANQMFYDNVDVSFNAFGVKDSLGLEISLGQNFNIHHNLVFIDEATWSAASPALNYHDIGANSKAWCNIFVAQAAGTNAGNGIHADWYEDSYGNVVAKPVQAAAAGYVLTYAEIFDGPSFSNLGVDDVEAAFTPQVGSPLLAMPIKVGPFGTGYYNFTTGVANSPAYAKPVTTTANGTTLTTVTFNGSTYMRATDASDPLLGFVDTDELTIAFGLALDATEDGVDNYVCGSAGDNLSVRKLSTNKIRVKLENVAGATIVEVDSSLTATSADGAKVWVISLKLSTYELCIMKGTILDGLPNITTWTGAAHDINRNTMDFMASVGSGIIKGSVTFFYMSDRFVDLNVVSNLDDIIALDGKPGNYGSDGSGLDGTIPRVYLTGNAAAWNSGSGLNLASGTAAHKFFVTGGTVT